MCVFEHMFFIYYIATLFNVIVSFCIQVSNVRNTNFVCNYRTCDHMFDNIINLCYTGIDTSKMYIKFKNMCIDEYRYFKSKFEQVSILQKMS